MRSILLAVMLVVPAFLLTMPSTVADHGGDGTVEDPDLAALDLLNPPIGFPYRVLFTDVTFHPDGDYALVLGGWRGPAHNPCGGGQFAMTYDGQTWDIVLNQTGCMLTNAAWHPDGSHAIIVAERNTILLWDADAYEADAFRDPSEPDPHWKDVWALSAFAVEGQTFLPRDVAYRPDGKYALITGNDLLRFIPYNDDGERVDLLYPGLHRSGDFYDAVAWSPDSKYAFMEAGLQDSNNTRALGAISVFADDEDMCAERNLTRPCVYSRTLYGKYDPGFTDIDGITFSPYGNAAWFYGYDGGKGTILHYTGNNDQFQWSYRYENTVDRISDMEWQPNSYRVLWAARGAEQLVSSQAWVFSPILDNNCHDRFPDFKPFTSGCPDLKDIAWHPSGEWAILISGGATGYALKFTPVLEPSVDIHAPTERNVVEDVLEARGQAKARDLLTNVTDVQWRIGDDEWENATVNATTSLSTSRWNASIDVTQLTPGSRHRLEVRASDDNGTTWSDTATVDFFVKSIEKFPRLTLTSPDGSGPVVTVENNVTLEWNALPEAYYVLQMSRDPTFAADTVTTLQSDDTNTTFTYFQHGVTHFRVRAVGGFQPGEWSVPLSVNVTAGRDRPVIDDLGPGTGIDVNATDDQNEAPDRNITDEDVDGGNDPENDDGAGTPFWKAIPGPGVAAGLLALGAARMTRPRR